jgi:hypothetical protein
VLGSSISMVVRPRGSGLPYPRVLETRLAEATDDVWIVDNLSRIAATVEDARDYAHRLVADQPEAIVIHYGHVEAVRRPLSRRAWYRLHEIRPGGPPWRPLVIRAGTRFAAVKRRLRLFRQWMPIGPFGRGMDELLGYLAEETAARVIVVEANPGNARVEAWCPGSMAAIRLYNRVMFDSAARVGATWVPLASFVHGPNEEFITDGTHLSGRGHVALADAIAEVVLAPPPTTRSVIDRIRS